MSCRRRHHPRHRVVVVVVVRVKPMPIALMRIRWMPHQLEEIRPIMTNNDNNNGLPKPISKNENVTRWKRNWHPIATIATAMRTMYRPFPFGVWARNGNCTCQAAKVTMTTTMTVKPIPCTRPTRAVCTHRCWECPMTIAWKKLKRHWPTMAWHLLPLPTLPAPL